MINLDEHTIHDEVLGHTEKMPDERLKQTSKKNQEEHHDADN